MTSIERWRRIVFELELDPLGHFAPRDFDRHGVAALRDHMHAGERNPCEHFIRPGEVELGEAREDEHSDLHGYLEVASRPPRIGRMVSEVVALRPMSSVPPAIAAAYSP